jgi:predicted O-methyltransferase YrrM
MLSTEEQQDPQAFAAAGITSSADFPAHLEPARRAELFSHVYMSVSASGGELLYLLARAAGAHSVVEYGTSFGVSTIYLASAVSDNGGGIVIGTELHPDKAAAARQNFTDAGVADLVDLRVGDARTTLKELPDVVDMLLLDGWPDLALDVLRVVEPTLRPGALIVIDDVDLDFGSDVYGPVLSYLADEANGYQSIKVPMADGFQLAVRVV